MVSALTSLIHKDTQCQTKPIPRPLPTICYLALHAYYPEGSKISVQREIYSIEGGAMATLIRTWNGDSRDDIACLLPTIKEALSLYPPNKSEDASLLFKGCVEGLKKLKATYLEAGNTASLIENDFIRPIEQALNEPKVTESIQVEGLWSNATLKTLGAAFSILKSREKEANLRELVEKVRRVIDGLSHASTELDSLTGEARPTSSSSTEASTSTATTSTVSLIGSSTATTTMVESAPSVVASLSAGSPSGETISSTSNDTGSKVGKKHQKGH